MKPENDKLYVLKFPNYYSTWRLKGETTDGKFIFFTSSGDITAPMNQTRFDFLTKRYLIQTVALSALNITTSSKIKINVEQSHAFRSREYTTKEEILPVDDIDEIEW